MNFSFDLSLGSVVMNGVRRLMAGLENANSTASYALSCAGSLVAYAANTLRYGCLSGQRAILVEAGATNLLTYATASATTGWTASSATVTDLDLDALGVFPGVKIASNGAVWNRLNHTATPNVTSGVSYHLQAFFKFGTSGKLRPTLVNVSGATETRVDVAVSGNTNALSAAGALSNVTIAAIGSGGVYQLDATFVPNFTGALNIGFGPASAVSGQDVVLLGAQFETGTSGTSFINSAGASTARAADLVTAPITADVSAGVRVRGTFCVKVEKDEYNMAFVLDAGTTASRITMSWQKSTALFGVSLFSGGVLQGTYTYSGAALGDTVEVDLTFTAAAISGSINGDAVSKALAGAYTPPTTARIGHSAGGASIPGRLLCSKFIVTGVPA
ncbi:phage head spike fiber domain-containing protein [Celeribacter sp. SCSIO 80788]|uniref:phage head spike fiber domain-containing protein n=1 Tax=Celeribacter sp. SCSIO 80788 TaxID=3117013 RepID=UPI003DA65249